MMSLPGSTVHGLGRAAFLGAVLTSIAGCGSDGSSDASKSGSRSAQPSPSAPKEVALPDYCKRVCERSTECGNQDATHLENLEPEVKAAIEKSAPETIRACVATCIEEPTTPARIQLADRCNQEKDCSTFAKCLNDLRGELKK